MLAVGQVNGVLGLFDPLTGKELLHDIDSRLMLSTWVFSPDQRWSESYR